MQNMKHRTSQEELQSFITGSTRPHDAWQAPTKAVAMSHAPAAMPAKLLRDRLKCGSTMCVTPEGHLDHRMRVVTNLRHRDRPDNATPRVSQENNARKMVSLLQVTRAQKVTPPLQCFMK